MNNYRRYALAAGALFILADVSTVVLAAIILKPIVGNPVDFATVAANEGQVFLAALLKLIGAAACAGIALSLYPVLRAHGPALALGSVMFRVIESAFYVVATIGLLTIVTMSGQAAGAGAADAALYDRLASLTMAMREDVGYIAGPFFFGLGALMYYWLMFRATLVPRWISGWGIVAAVGAVSAASLALLGVVAPLSPAHLALNVPIALQEIVLAVWLIAKGFSPAVVAAAAPAGPNVALAGAGAR
jgi:hypothetical protein